MHIMSFMPPSTYILFFLAFILTLFLNDAFFKQKHLRMVSEKDLEESSYYLVKIAVEIGRALQCIDLY